MIAAEQVIINDCTKLPASSIVQADLLKQRGKSDKVFSAGDEVVVALDCAAHTLRLWSPMATVQYVIQMQQRSGC